jgi:hypothetical protein
MSSQIVEFALFFLVLFLLVPFLMIFLMLLRDNIRQHGRPFQWHKNHSEKPAA